MEQLNRVELRGTVGSVYIKDFGTTRCVNFSVATNYCFKDETTWHRVLAWENQDTKDAFKMKKGDSVHVFGRLRIQRHTGADGVEKQAVEIVAKRVDKS